MLDYVVSFLIAPLVGIVWLLWTEGILKWYVVRAKHGDKKIPPAFLSMKNDGTVAGWVECILGLTGPKAPFIVYEGYKRTCPEGHPWIMSGRFPSKTPSGFAFAVADIDIAKEILTAPHSVAGKSIMYDGVDGLTCGYGNIFTANGHRWKHARKGVAPAFSSNHIKRMVRVCAQRLDTFIKTIVEPSMESGKPFNVGEEFVGLTLSIISDAAFEYEMSREEQKLFTSNLENAAECFVIMNPLHQKFPWLFPRVWSAKRSAKIIQQLAHRIMANYRKKHGDKPKTNDRVYEDDTIISRIINNPNYASDDERAADIVILLAAGHDTTAYSISWTLLETMRNRPAELDEYRRKIKDLPEEEWKRVDELQYIIKEGMRLQPVLAMGTVRDVGKEIVYQCEKGEKVVCPKDSIYFINLFPMFRNPAYYDEPDKFMPSRWKNPKREDVHVPFSIGSRNCIGQTLANAELHTVLAVLLGKYDFTVVDEGYPEYLTTLKPVDCMMVPKKLA